MSEKQKTIQKETTLEGIGLHTGSRVKVCFKPGEVNTGINFVRIDLPGAPVIKADVSNVLTDDKSLPRCTSIGNGEAVIHTAEHLMSTLAGLGIDNLTIEINGKEVPGLDGSGIDFLKALKEAGIKEQEAAKEYFEIKEPVWVERNGSSILAVPASDFRISYVLDYNRPELLPQCFNTQMQPDTFEREIAPCRTFCLESEAEELKRNGLGKGANYKNTLVITKDGVKDNKVRFPNEFARHKTLDLIGDLYLLGMPIKGHVFAIKSGHTLNVALLKKIAEQKKKYQTKSVSIVNDFANAQTLDIASIMKILPHRYPFLLVDRIIALEPGKKAVGVKNVTINDGFFQGHFPSRPIMPGVLMVEAMAQVGGIAVLTDSRNSGQVAFFLSADKVKFRKVVLPGDQLVMEVEVVKIRGKTAQVSAQSKVNGEVVAEAQMMFSFVEANYLAQS